MYNYHRFSRFFEPPEPLSILELVNSGTLNLRLAGLLWLMMEQRSSVLVAAGPNYAGKTTTLNALLDFLPPDIRRVYLYGDYQDFSFTEDVGPGEIYMVAEEFNTYLDYVWGDTAINAFKLLKKGYSMGGTIHARTPQEAVYIFHRYLGLTLPLISHIDAVVNLSVTWDANRERTQWFEPLRQIDSVSLLVPQDDAILLEPLALRETGQKNLQFTRNENIRQAFIKKYNNDYPDIGNEISIREKYLEKLMTDVRISYLDVREAIKEFYNSRQP